MDKNTIVGLLLMAAVFIGFSWYSQRNAPQPAPETAQTAAADKQGAAKDAAAKPAVAAQPDSADVFLAARGGKPQTVTLHNNRLTVDISTKGGTVSRVLLNEYKSYADFKAGADKPLVLYNDQDAAMSLVLDTKTGAMDFSDYIFTPVAATDSTVTMRLTGKGGETLELRYSLLPDNYLVNFTIQSSNLTQAVSASTKTLRMDWRDRVAQHEKGFYFENMYSTLTYKPHGHGTEKMKENGDDEKQPEGGVDWMAFKNQYFSAVLLSELPLTDAQLASKEETEGSGYLKSYSATMNAQFDPMGKKPTVLQFYFGPNNYRLLQSMDKHKVSSHDYDLQDLVYLGWPIVRWVNRFFTLYVFDFLTRLGLPMGIVLLLITLLLRAIVYVPTRKSFLSSAKMRVLKPKVDAIAAKYPRQEDALKRQQETMTLYSQYGANPMGGCLPMLIQMPIWIAMFNFVPNAIELRQQSFLWADDLSTYDSLLSWSYDIPFLGNHLSLFCLLFCATNLLYSVMTMRQQRETMSGEQAQQMKMMQWMMLLMPLFFFFMFNKYSAGLNYYYFISLLFSALTMWYLRRTTDDEKLLRKLEAKYEANKNNPNKKPGMMSERMAALQKRYEEMAKMQEQQRKG